MGFVIQLGEAIAHIEDTLGFRLLNLQYIFNKRFKFIQNVMAYLLNHWEKIINGKFIIHS